MPSIYFLKEWILQLDTSVAIQLIILLILLILSGFFSSAETALTTVNRMRIRGLADEGNKKAKTVMHHEPIIDRADFETVQRILENAPVRRPNGDGEIHPLSGLMF